MSDLHGKIMNIQADHAASTADYKSKREAYIFGHRDARHAAAELAVTHAGAAAEPVDWLAANNSPLHRQLCMKPDACSECDRIAALTSAPAEPAASMERFEHVIRWVRDNYQDNSIASLCDGLRAAYYALCRPAETPPAAGAIDTRTAWENFPAYLIDHCEGDTISEVGLQRALADMLKDPKYTNPVSAIDARGQEAAPSYRIFKDGDKWCAVGPDFIDLQKSPAGFADTPGLALEQLMKEFGKEWAEKNGEWVKDVRHASPLEAPASAGDAQAVAKIRSSLDAVYASLKDRDCLGAAVAMEGVLKTMDAALASPEEAPAASEKEGLYKTLMASSLLYFDNGQADAAAQVLRVALGRQHEAHHSKKEAPAAAGAALAVGYDCGEAGCTEGCCGNASCLPSARRACKSPPLPKPDDMINRVSAGGEDYEEPVWNEQSMRAYVSAALAATPAPETALADDETCDLIGIKADGTRTELGKAPIPPMMKARDVVRSYFGGDVDDEMSDASMALQCCREVIDYMKRAALKAAQPIEREDGK
jgi:hypothetical protein